MEGTFYCEDCGQPLYGKFNVASTRRMEPANPSTVMLDQEPVFSIGTMRLTTTGSLVFQITGAKEPIVMPSQSELLLGRADPIANIAPAVDLTPFGAVEHGVSRSHAVIRIADETPTLVDLGSVNGTHLNGHRLSPNQPRILRDGDEIQLGKLVMRVYFK
jgi:hypothetical protein